MHRPHVIRLLLCAGLLVLLLNPCIAKADTTIRATVAAVRCIVLDNRGKIIRIDSNTTRDVVPTVRYLSVTGPSIPLTPRVNQEFQAIKQRLNFSRAGIIFSQKESSWAARLLGMLNYLNPRRPTL